MQKLEKEKKDNGTAIEFMAETLIPEIQVNLAMRIERIKADADKKIAEAEKKAAKKTAEHRAQLDILRESSRETERELAFLGY